MQHSILDLGSPALIPELGADVAAGAAGDIQLVLVAVVALRALPHQLAVLLYDLDLAIVAADLAVVTLGVQLGVHDVLIDELHDLDDGLEVVLHVGHLHIADGAAGGEVLELRLELELGERVDLFRHVDVVGVRDIALVRHTLDHAEALLQALGELVGRGLERRSVEGVVDVFGGFPLLALVVHLLHDGEGEGRGTGVGVALAGHVLHALVESCVAERDGGVAVIEQAVDRFALFEPCARAVLPENGSGVGQRTLQTVVAAAQGAVAELKALVENRPELFDVAACGQRHIRQVDRDNALVEAAVELVIAVFILQTEQGFRSPDPLFLHVVKWLEKALLFPMECLFADTAILLQQFHAVLLISHVGIFLLYESSGQIPEWSLYR